MGVQLKGDACSSPNAIVEVKALVLELETGVLDLWANLMFTCIWSNKLRDLKF